MASHYKLIIIVFAFILFHSFSGIVFGENDKKYTPSISPINSNIKFITFLTPGYGIAGGKQIIIHKNGQWLKYPYQPPAPVDMLFPLDSASFFVTSVTKFQESKLYFGNGNKWNEIWCPLANTISAMYFTDRENGVVAGLGEIVLLKNNRWHWLPPPGNKSIHPVILKNDSTVWACIPNTGLFKYDGKWTKIKSSERIVNFHYVHNSIYVLAGNAVGLVDGNDSIVFLTSDTALTKANALFVFNKNSMVAAGQHGLILRLKNGRWRRMPGNTTEQLNAIWMVNDSTGWIAGNNGVLLNMTAGRIHKTATDNWKGFEISTLISSYAKVIDDEYGVVVADFNKDGLPDIFTCGLFEANHLYINAGNNTFFDKAQQWNVTGETSKEYRELNLGACAADFDNDGDDDLYVTSLNGRNKIYLNIKSRHFVDYSDISNGTGNKSDRTNAVVCGDVDNDGDIDIFITNENTTNRLFLNNGAGIFEEVTQKAGLTSSHGGTGCSFGDIDNDGDLDLYVANWSTMNILYKNLLEETGQLVFKNITEAAGVGGEIYTKSNAVVFADIDNDADLDLFVTNRKTCNKLYINNGKGLFIDKTMEMLGIDSLKSYGAVMVDFDGDGYKDIYLSNVGRNVFYKNYKGKKFVDKTLKYHVDIKGYSTGAAAADFDNTGSPDIYIANYIGEGSTILMNSKNNSQIINVKVKGAANNYDGIGTKIFVYAEDDTIGTSGLIFYTEISGGSGYASMNQRFLPIAIPSHDFVDIKVIFPMGETKILKHVKIGSPVVVEDETGIKKSLSLTCRYLLLHAKDPHRLLKLLAWIFIILIITIALIDGSYRYKWTLYYSIPFVLLLLFTFYFQSDYFEYRNIWLSTVLPVLNVIVLIMLNYLFFERNKIKIAASAEQERMQKKLSRDLHDDLGSTVSTIGIYLTLIRYNLKNNEKELNQLLDKITELVNDTATAITDMVWAVNPKPESLDNLILRINKNFVPVFREKGTLFTVKPKMDIENINLNPKVKHNIYLIIKEALNNILKYANAPKVIITIEEFGREIALSIKDNGKGFDPEAVKNKGHGITNMHLRAEDINARLNIKSTMRIGTEINIIFKPG